MRPIDADALKEAFEEDGHLSGYIEDFINDVPTLDVEPVRRGEWVNVSFETLCETNGFEHRLGSAQCSECDYWAYMFNDYDNVFDLARCPNCGAKMEVE